MFAAVVNLFGRRILALFAASAVAAGALTGVSAVLAPAPAHASLSGFDAGNIISDEVFFDSTTLTSDGVRDFLGAKIGSCAPGATCLLNFRQTTWTRGADTYCRGYAGAASEPSWQIIAKVASSCGVSPKVLIVTLQKERGLVTKRSTNSGDWNVSMGYGCPDTAACDTQYYGFYNQVWNAARQFKRYGNGSFRYNPGWNTIQWSPNAACGSSRVWVANKATAALYNYTPYQPNAAALASGYGTGDGCSTYGNRNFYNYYTDWFGSTREPARTLVIAGSDPTVFLLSAGKKHAIPTWDLYLELAQRLGPMQWVEKDFLNAIPTGTPASRLVRDPGSTGVYVLQDGARHWFDSYVRMVSYGYGSITPVDLDPRQLSAFPETTPVSDFLLAPGSNDVFQLSGTTRRHVVDEATFAWLTGGGIPFTIRVDSRTWNSMVPGTSLISTGTLVRERSTGDVFAIVGDSTMIHIAEYATPAEYGWKRAIVVPDGTLAGYTRLPGSLSLFATCGSALYAVGSQKAVAVTGDLPSGFNAPALPAASCNAIAKSGSTSSDLLFFRFADDDKIYRAENGAFRHVVSESTWRVLTGDRSSTVVVLAPAMRSALKIGAPIVRAGEFLRFTDSGTVYREENGRLRGVRTEAQLLQMNAGSWPRITLVSPEFRGAYQFGPSF